MTLINLIGIAGAFIVTYSNIPQIVLFVKQGHAQGISISSTWLALLGVSFRTIYLIDTTNSNFVVLGPYYFAILCLLLTLKYCYFPKAIK